MSSSSIKTPVCIVGGGPVGMVLALDLARQGVRSMLVNTEATTRWYPKGNTHNSRTMEHYRRLGLSSKIRAVGLPADHPTDVAYLTRVAGHEVLRFRLPSSNENIARAARCSATDQVPERLHRANQMFVERILFAAILVTPLIEVRYGWHCVDFEERRDIVKVEIKEIETDRSEVIECLFLVGCDGGKSFVRENLGIKLSGDGPSGTSYLAGPMASAYLRIPDFTTLIREPAWMYHIVNAERRATFVSLNGTDEYSFSTNRTTDMRSDNEVMRLAKASIGRDIEVSVIARSEWTGGIAMVADAFWSGHRVFLCGDAAHLFSPSGGFGMNTGIDDAANLAWKLAAVVQGWGAPLLLRSYEEERRRIAIRNTKAARDIAVSYSALSTDPCLETDTAEGMDARRELARVLGTFAEKYGSLGIQLGARYDGSPIVVSDNTDPPVDDPSVYVPSACPGGRAPHFWIAPDTSLYDHLGPGFTVIRFDSDSSNISGLCAAAERIGVPLRVLDVENPAARELYQCALVLIRPDQHVAWRDRPLQDDPEQLIKRITGHV